MIFVLARLFVCHMKRSRSSTCQIVTDFFCGGGRGTPARWRFAAERSFLDQFLFFRPRVAKKTHKKARCISLDIDTPGNFFPVFCFPAKPYLQGIAKAQQETGILSGVGTATKDAPPASHPPHDDFKHRKNFCTTSFLVNYREETILPKGI